LSIFLVWKTPRARAAVCNQQGLYDALCRLRGWARGGGYLSLSVLQMMGATLLEQGSAPAVAVPKPGKNKPPIPFVCKMAMIGPPQE